MHIPTCTNNSTGSIHVYMYINCTVHVNYLVYCMPQDELTSSVALISAPLSSRANTVAVWPFSDER